MERGVIAILLFVLCLRKPKASSLCILQKKRRENNNMFLSFLLNHFYVLHSCIMLLAVAVAGVV